jgi:hypothetical protein
LSEKVLCSPKKIIVRISLAIYPPYMYNMKLINTI